MSRTREIRRKHKTGYVYMVTNPAWPGWVKIGYTWSTPERIKVYNQSCPLKDFVMTELYCGQGYKLIEQGSLSKLRANHRNRGEWVPASEDDVRNAVRSTAARLGGLEESDRFLALSDEEIAAEIANELAARVHGKGPEA